VAGSGALRPSSPTLLDRISPPRDLGVAAAPGGSSLGPRTLRAFELVWLVEGGARYEHDGIAEDAPEGSIVICRSGVRDLFTWDALAGCRHAYVHFDLLEPPPDWPAPSDWPTVVRPQDGDVVRPLFRHLLTHGPGGRPELSQLTLAHLLASLVLGQSGTRQPPRQRIPEPVTAAFEHMQAALARDPSRRIALGELAGAAHVSPAHLCRLFAGATGRSPVETVRLLRLDHAAALLVRSNLSVAQIATTCGFADAFTCRTGSRRPSARRRPRSGAPSTRASCLRCPRLTSFLDLPAPTLRPRPRAARPPAVGHPRT
jgi:AraC-like DNA-binding protein